MSENKTNESYGWFKGGYSGRSIDDDLRGEDLQRRIDDRELKKDIAKWVKCIIKHYLIAVAIVVMSYIVGKYRKVEIMSDAVLITILTTTTFNLLGMPYIMLRSLFKSEESDK
jgi:hypothetical protein